MNKGTRVYIENRSQIDKAVELIDKANTLLDTISENRRMYEEDLKSFYYRVEEDSTISEITFETSDYFDNLNGSTEFLSRVLTRIEEMFEEDIDRGFEFSDDEGYYEVPFILKEDVLRLVLSFQRFISVIPYKSFIELESEILDNLDIIFCEVDGKVGMGNKGINMKDGVAFSTGYESKVSLKKSKRRNKSFIEKFLGMKGGNKSFIKRFFGMKGK